MRKTMAFLAAVILMAIGFTFISGVVDNTYAKTAIVGYGSVSAAPNGEFSAYKFDGPGLGIGVKFRVGKRISIGLDYTHQGISKPGWEYGDIADGWNGESIVGAARMFEMDISQFNIPFDANYLLAYSKETKSGAFNLATGTFYISLAPKNGSRRVVEPKVGFTAGFAFVQDGTNSEYYYHPVIEYLMPGATSPGSGFLFTGDDGSHYSHQSKIKSKPVGGFAFGLDFFPAEHFTIPLEARWLAGYGANFRIGGGVVF